jgi:hypothetical protein
MVRSGRAHRHCGADSHPPALLPSIPPASIAQIPVTLCWITWGCCTVVSHTLRLLGNTLRKVFQASTRTYVRSCVSVGITRKKPTAKRSGGQRYRSGPVG